MASPQFYLKRDRLSDVLALIQVLGLDEHAHRAEEGLQKELQGIPKSSSSWATVANEHPEFFRVEERQHGISLIARHVTGRDNQGQRKLEPELLQKLMEIAIDLHDRQREKSISWNIWIPVITVAVSSLLSLLINLNSKSRPSIDQSIPVKIELQNIAPNNK